MNIEKLFNMHPTAKLSGWHLLTETFRNENDDFISNTSIKVEFVDKPHRLYEFNESRYQVIMVFIDEEVFRNVVQWLKEQNVQTLEEFTSNTDEGSVLKVNWSMSWNCWIVDFCKEWGNNLSSIRRVNVK